MSPLTCFIEMLIIKVLKVYMQLLDYDIEHVFDKADKLTEMYKRISIVTKSKSFRLFTCYYIRKILYILILYPYIFLSLSYCIYTDTFFKI